MSCAFLPPLDSKFDLVLSLFPQRLCCEARAFRKSRKLCPGDLRMHPTAEPTVGRGDDILAPHRPGKADDAIGHEFRMLQHVGGVTDQARDDDLAVRKFGALPDFPLCSWRTLPASTE